MKRLALFACMVAAMFVSLPASTAIASRPAPAAERSLVIMVRPVIVKSERELMLLIGELDAAGLDFMVEKLPDATVVVLVLWYGE